MLDELRLLAGASGVYLSGGFGPWELIYPVIGTGLGFARYSPTDGSASAG
ncbi:MAG TPA: hypothetical protein VHU82_12750 [Vicinamibacterales bacterium]|jgi:hypothetical protein|nr:hypothetical protein [Vicinamibacterales bacterium]